MDFWNGVIGLLRWRIGCYGFWNGVIGPHGRQSLWVLWAVHEKGACQERRGLLEWGPRPFSCSGKKGTFGMGS